MDSFCRNRHPYCYCMSPLHRQNIWSAQLCFDNILLGILCIFLILDFVNISQQGNQCKIHSQFVQLRVDISQQSILYSQYRFRSNMFHTNILKTNRLSFFSFKRTTNDSYCIVSPSTLKMPMNWPNFINFTNVFTFLIFALIDFQNM